MVPYPPHPSRGAVGSDRAFPTPGRPVPTDQCPEVQQGLVPLDIGSLGSGQFMRGKPEPPVRLPGNLAQHPAGDSPCVGVYQYAGPAKGEAEDSGGYVVPHPGMATSCCQLSGTCPASRSRTHRAADTRLSVRQRSPSMASEGSNGGFCVIHAWRWCCDGALTSGFGVFLCYCVSPLYHCGSVLTHFGTLVFPLNPGPTIPARGADSEWLMIMGG